MDKILSATIVAMLVIGGLSVGATEDKESDFEHLETTIIISDPVIKEEGAFLSVELQEATSFIREPGSPKLPFIAKVFTFPFGTQISSVSCEYNNIVEKSLNKKIIPASEPVPVSLKYQQKTSINPVDNNKIYSSKQVFPSKDFEYRIGSGLDDNNHVFFLTVYCYPIKYSPLDDTLLISKEISINIKYQPAEEKMNFGDNIDLMIITPDEFTNSVEPLVDHKIAMGLNTALVTTEDIYTGGYQGRDEAEQIKYFIKESIETLGIKYVLLIGSVYILPMRDSHVSLWRFEDNVITDLYYADIYDGGGLFCSWDLNNNDEFGEENVDGVDLYPDVHIGRLACENIDEVDIIVDKIIHYETETYGQSWFNDMIFIGGDTFPRWGGNEGEELNVMIMNIMSDFNPSSVIWTSEDNFNRKTISDAINKGAGFLDYSGHGFEHGMGTYPPDGKYLRTYLTPYIDDLNNGYELPIIFFDACLTAKLDFVLKDLLSYKQYWAFYALAILLRVDINRHIPVYAWSYLSHENGGAIATIGATRTAYGGVSDGAGKMSLEFFRGYSTSEYLGEMMTYMQNEYIHDVIGDAFTVEEFMLLGDPSLKIGGYQ